MSVYYSATGILESMGNVPRGYPDCEDARGLFEAAGLAQGEDPLILDIIWDGLQSNDKKAAYAAFEKWRAE